MPEFDNPIDSRNEGADFSLSFTEIWIDDRPVGVYGGFEPESLANKAPMAPMSWFSRFRRRKLRFPSRITF